MRSRRSTWIQVLAAVALLLLAGCSSNNGSQHAWVDDEVSFVADGLTVHGTYRHQHGGSQAPAALLISESGRTDRNGDNNVAGPIGNMRQLAEYLSEHGVASLRYDKVGTGQTGLGPYAEHAADVGSAVYTTGAKSAVRFLADQSGTDKNRISVYALGEGTIHAMTLADDTSAGAPKIHTLALLQPLAGRYLDLITARVNADMAAAVASGQKNRQQADQAVAEWNAAVEQVRTKGTVPPKLPEGLSAILNPGNAKAVAEADAIDPLDLAARIPAGTPVLVTCSDADGQANCADMKPLTAALAHTALTFVQLKGVNHVLRDDPTDNVGNYAKPGPLSPQLTAALDQFVTK
ncbi:alpha/beta hydrolase family protein [Mycolicibacterium sp. CBM1]